MTTRNDTEIRQRRLAHEICTALDASAERVPADIAERLSAARRIALARRKAEAPAVAPALAAAGRGGGFSDDPAPLHMVGDWLRRLGLVWVMLTLVAGLAGIYQWQQQNRIDELADVDSAMLLDDLPPSAYADQGFHVFLKQDE